MLSWKRLLTTWIGRLPRPFEGSTAAETAEQMSVLIITQNTADRDSLRSIGALHGWQVLSAESCDEAIARLKERSVPLVICDQDIPGSWRDTIARIAFLPQPICILLASRVIDEYLLREVIHHHGYDVIVKPFRAEDLIRSLTFAWTWHRSAFARWWCGAGKAVS
jgi:two-component system response regulator FlrC